MCCVNWDPWLASPHIKKQKSSYGSQHHSFSSDVIKRSWNKCPYSVHLSLLAGKHMIQKFVHLSHSCYDRIVSHIWLGWSPAVLLIQTSRGIRQKMSLSKLWVFKMFVGYKIYLCSLRVTHHDENLTVADSLQESFFETSAGSHSSLYDRAFCHGLWFQTQNLKWYFADTIY